MAKAVRPLKDLGKTSAGTRSLKRSTATNGAAQPAVTQKKAAPKSAPAATFEDTRQMVQLRMGQLLLAAARLPRYRDLSLKTLMAAFLEPLQRGRIAFAEQGEGAGSLLGMAVWASVSDAVSARIESQIEAGTFPVALAANDWTSGETLWLLDLIVPSRKAGTAVFTNFTKVIGERTFRLHPIVAGSLDADIVAQINALIEGKGA